MKGHEKVPRRLRQVRYARDEAKRGLAELEAECQRLATEYHQAPHPAPLRQRREEQWVRKSLWAKDSVVS